MTQRILLVNPPIYDFTAYDFWLKPLGLLSVAGLLRGRCELSMFDYLDRLHPSLVDKSQNDHFSRGKFYSVKIQKPELFGTITRHYRRFGLERSIFREFLAERGPFDFALIQTLLTYWYPGVKEAIEDIRQFSRKTKIILGGPYATICNTHAKALGADMVIRGTDLRPLWRMLDIIPHKYQPPLWERYEKLDSAAIKLTRGCPFECTYCSVPQVYPEFVPRSPLNCAADIDLLCERGVKDIAFYDDSLLYQPARILMPFLEYILQKNIKVNFHTPNALHARFVTGQLAQLLVRAGFKTFYLGFESSSETFHKQTGSKVISAELVQAVGYLKEAGADTENITAYQLLGHPKTDPQKIEDSMRFVNELGIRIMLSDFSPIPGTPDGKACSEWIDLKEPLNHNKTAFPIIMMGFDKVNHLKQLRKKLNAKLNLTSKDSDVFQ